jgi:hypothetical protein
MKTDPHCHWCGCEVVYFTLQRGQVTPTNFATIDHLNSRLANPDGRPLVGEQVLSCNGCNQTRNREEETALPIEELWRRSLRCPRDLRVLAHAELVGVS